MYYGQNVISKNLILANRWELLNANGFVLGVSGSGKSFTAKREMVGLALAAENGDGGGTGRHHCHRPGPSTGPSSRGLGGEVIEASATSPNHINAMDMEQGYGDGENPVVLKSEFLLSLCEQLMGSGKLSAKEKSIIDRCAAQCYREYIRSDYKGAVPTLQDFHAELLRQPEPEARDVALAIELFTEGSLNTFAKPTNVQTRTPTSSAMTSAIWDDSFCPWVCWWCWTASSTVSSATTSRGEIHGSTSTRYICCSSMSTVQTSCLPSGSVSGNTAPAAPALRRMWTTSCSPTPPAPCWQTVSSLSCSIRRRRIGRNWRDC